MAAKDLHTEREFDVGTKTYYLLVKAMYAIISEHWLPTHGENTRMRATVQTVIERAHDAVSNPLPYLEGSKGLVPGWSLADQCDWSSLMARGPEHVGEVGMRIAMWTIVRDYLLTPPRHPKDEKEPTRNETVEYLSGKQFSGVPNAADIAYPKPMQSGDLAELMAITCTSIDSEAPLFAAGMRELANVFRRREAHFLALTECNSREEFEALAKRTSTTVNENDGSERLLSRTKYHLKLAPHMKISTAGILAALQENKTIEWVLSKPPRVRDVILNTASKQMPNLIKRLREDDRKVEAGRVTYKRTKHDEGAKRKKRKSTKKQGRKRARKAESDEDTASDQDDPGIQAQKRNLRTRKQRPRLMVGGPGMLALPSSDESQADTDDEYRPDNDKMRE